jgi:hypothetical protein
MDTILTTAGFIVEVVKDYGFKGVLCLLAAVFIYMLVCAALFVHRNWNHNVVSGFANCLKQFVALNRTYLSNYILKPKKWLSLWK